MKSTRSTITGLLALGLAASSFSLAAVSPAYATGDCGCGCDCPEPEEPRYRANNGFGQEKRGFDDGTNAGSDNGGGEAQGGPGVGLTGAVSKQDESDDNHENVYENENLR
jgi:hypothetical protein